MTKLNLSDISFPSDKINVQNYASKPVIDGVKVFEIKKFAGEDGTFEDLVRVNESGFLELIPDFQLRQINRSKLMGGAVKAWHLHLNQEDIWYVSPENQMLLGLWDLRNGSTTRDLKMRIILGAGQSKLVYIPRGVAHGVVNLKNKPGTIIYLVNQQFNQADPDEYRIAWDGAGADFWQPTRE